MSELFELIERYKALQDETDALKEKLDALKGEILVHMKDENLTKVELPSGITATLTNSTTYKYTDEPKIIEYLKTKGLTNYIVEKVNTTPLNTEIKKGVTLTEDLKPYYTTSVTQKLTVK